MFPISRRRVLAHAGAFACLPVLPLAAAEEKRAASLTTPAPGPRDVCPVCGMFVAKYPAWVATVVFKDGKAEHFDGAKDLYKYLLDMPRWARGRTAGEIATIAVTSYYETERIAAADAVYVIGSDVYGPMGHELVPHATKADADEFLIDHKGKRSVRAADITLALLAALDEGKLS